MAPYDKYGKNVNYSWETSDFDLKQKLQRKEFEMDYLEKRAKGYFDPPKPPEPKYSWQTSDPVKKSELLRKEWAEEDQKKRDNLYLNINKINFDLGSLERRAVNKPIREEDKEETDCCFIATAVYGDINHPQVESLRNFRDNVLTKYDLGQKFTDFYYSGAGKKTADFITKHLPTTIPIIRKGLDIFLMYINK